MPVMGIESSAHTLGIGISENGNILANERMAYSIGNRGIIPMRVADFHSKNVGRVLKDALHKANLNMKDISAIGYTKGPGLGPCLEVGQIAARALSIEYNIPIFYANHAVAHIEITRSLFRFLDPLALYVSGGNSQILQIAEKPYRHYRVLGETFDIGVGNMIDSFARSAGLNPAWGSTVAKIAKNGRYVRMPYTVKGMDFTFTGLQTSAIKLLKTKSVRDVAYSIQETAFAMLCEATERAILLTNKRELLLCGGVAQSERLQEMLTVMSKSHSVKFGVLANEFNGDNGAMIALLAEKMYKSGTKHRLAECSIDQKYRIEKFNVTW